MFKTQKGFTLIEILVVITIFIILGAISIAGIRYFQSQTNLNNDAEKIIATLRLAQNKTIASESESIYGVHFENNFFVLFKGDIYNPNSPDNNMYYLSPRTEIYAINLNGQGTNIIFNRVTGNTDQYGAIKLRLISLPNQTKTISIDSIGQVFLGDQKTYPNPTNQDTRHIHIDYNKNIKNASLLRLTYPDDNISYDINFPDHLNANQTAFYWKATITINGQPQTLEILTHSLTDISTQISIKRDKRYNNKSLQIYIDGDNLINYTASGTATKGLSPFISTPQIQ